MNPIANEFIEVLEAINDVSLFLSLTNGENLFDDDIEKILHKSHYIEQFVTFINTSNFTDVFERKAKEYFEMKGKNIIPSVLVMEYYSDEVLTKILILQTSRRLTGYAIKMYLNYCSYKRFEDLIKKLVDFRILFVDVSHQLKEILHPSEIECILLVECWLKIIYNGEEGLDAFHLVVKKMFLNPESIKTLIKILCLEIYDQYREIQDIVVNTIATDFCNKTYLSSWKIILEAEQLEEILIKFVSLLDPILSVVEIIGNEIKYNSVNKFWELSILNDLDYEGFIKILQKLSSVKTLHYKLKKLVYISKMKGNVAIWKNIEKDLNPNDT